MQSREEASSTLSNGHFDDDDEDDDDNDDGDEEEADLDDNDNDADSLAHFCSTLSEINGLARVLFQW